MAKTQTFGDKLKKKLGDQRPNIKVIKWYRDENRNGNLRCLEKFVKVDDLSQVDNIDVNK